MPVSPSCCSAHDILGASCLAVIASYIPYRRGFTASKPRHKRGAATIQLGWGVRFAHCCTTTFDAVKTAHLAQLQTLKDISPFRHPLYHPERSGGRPPFRLDQAIHLITRIRPTSPVRRWNIRSSQQGVVLIAQPALACTYQHHSERRSLVIPDCYIEQPP
jgi:hypothetical protein